MKWSARRAALVLGLAGLGALGLWRARERLAAALLDWGMAPLDRLGLARLRARTVGPAAGRVLEIGVGTGRNFGLYQKARLVVALDPDLTLLAQAARQARRERRPVYLVAGRAEALPFRSAAFDTVVATLVFCTVGDPAQGLAEVRRVLAPGGELRLLEHVRAPWPWLAVLQERLTPLWQRLAGGCHLDRETATLVRAAGFTLETVRPHLGGLLLEIVARPA